MLQCKHTQEFSFGPRALKDALISTNPALQELYAKAFSRAEKLFLSEAYNPQRTLFCTLLIRTAFDWLLSHPDAPEDFETFYHAMLRRKQSFCRKHIYLQPIGKASALSHPEGHRREGGTQLYCHPSSLPRRQEIISARKAKSITAKVLLYPQSRVTMTANNTERQKIPWVPLGEI